MKFEEINPFVRCVRLIDDKNRDDEGFVASYDCTLLYFSKGSGRVVFKNAEYNVSRGSALVFRAGVFYKIICENAPEYYVVNFDYVRDVGISKSYPMLPVSEAEFNKKNIISNVTFLDNTAFNEIVFVEKMIFTEDRFTVMLAEFGCRESYYECKLSCDLFSLLIDASRIQMKTDDGKSHRAADVENILNFIHENYNTDISNKRVGKKFNFSPKYINELVKARTGYSMHKYIIACRISKSIDFLQNSDMRIAEISEETGFTNIAHFSKYFKRIIGISPSMYRAKKNNYIK